MCLASTVEQEDTSAGGDAVLAAGWLQGYAGEIAVLGCDAIEVWKNVKKWADVGEVEGHRWVDKSLGSPDVLQPVARMIVMCSCRKVDTDVLLVGLLGSVGHGSSTGVAYRRECVEG